MIGDVCLPTDGLFALTGGGGGLSSGRGCGLELLQSVVMGVIGKTKQVPVYG